MAQLKDSIIDGNLSVRGDIILETNNNGVRGIHPNTGETSRIIHMSDNGNTIIGYDGYVNGNGNTRIYGVDIVHHIGSAGNADYRPYRRAGHSIDFNIRTSGYVTNSSKDVIFVVPTTIPTIGSPTVTATSIDGFILRQNGNYTHGSSASTYVTPLSYSVSSYYNVGYIITAHFENATNVTNNDTIGVTWSGNITLS